MTEDQKETLKFYTTNDYLLINGLLWGEPESTIDEYIQVINEDGLAVIKEAVELGFDVRWNCSKEEGQKLYQIYQRRFPVIKNKDIKREIINRAKRDISNMMECLEPLSEAFVLYRNIKTKFIRGIQEGQNLRCLGFSSCSLNPHIAENATYGSNHCTLFEINVPAGAPAIRLDLMKDIQNEPDEIILSPLELFITRIDKERRKIYAEVIKCDEVTQFRCTVENAFRSPVEHAVPNAGSLHSLYCYRTLPRIV